MFVGHRLNLKCPDDRVVQIRETNGNDDAILSNLADLTTGDNFYKFLSDITMEDSLLGKKPTVQDTCNWPVNTINYVLIQQRIFNHGPLLEFTKTCQNPKCKKSTDFEQNLEEYVGNGAEDVFTREPTPELIKPYPMGADPMVEFQTSSGKKFRFKILTGELEKRALEAGADDAHQNTKLLMRELEVYNAGAWLPLTSFHGISSREMSEIRANVNKYDPTFSPMVDCSCPKCGNPSFEPLFTIPGFYFPVPKI